MTITLTEKEALIVCLALELLISQNETIKDSAEDVLRHIKESVQ